MRSAVNDCLTGSGPPKSSQARVVHRLFGHLFLVASCILFRASPVGAAEPLTALDLVPADTAFCLEIPHLEESWTQVEASPLLQRVRQFPHFQRLLESRGFQQWQMVEAHVANLTGQKLSTQLRALFGKSFVIAISIPTQGDPQGVLIAEAIDPAAIETAIQTWNKLEPNEITTTKLHRGFTYWHRKKNLQASESLFYAFSGAWLVASDRELQIQQVIDRLISSTELASLPADRQPIHRSPQFARNRQRLCADGVAYIHVNARPWDRILAEAAQRDRESLAVAEIWQQIGAVSGSLALDRGAVCEAVFELETTKFPSGWSELVAATKKSPSWASQIPAESLFVVYGRLELATLIRHLLNQIPAADRRELEKLRRIAQSLLSGQDPFYEVLPSLLHDFGGFVVMRRDDHTKNLMLDGVLGVTADSPAELKMFMALHQGLETGLSLLAAYFSAEGPELVTVRREDHGLASVRSLSATAPVPLAYGLKGPHLIAAGSRERLLQTLNSLDNDNAYPRLKVHADRYFAAASQLVWLDVANVRSLLNNQHADVARLFAHGSVDEANRLDKRLVQMQSALQMIDSLFIASRIESDHVHVVFGAGLDAE